VSQDIADIASEIANTATAKAQLVNGDAYARELATTFTAAWACALSALIGNRAAAAQIYALADAIATGDR